MKAQFDLPDDWERGCCYNCPLGYDDPDLDFDVCCVMRWRSDECQLEVVSPKEGYWYEKKDKTGYCMYCSSCNAKVAKSQRNRKFCPVCGSHNVYSRLEVIGDYKNDSDN